MSADFATVIDNHCKKTLQETRVQFRSVTVVNRNLRRTKQVDNILNSDPYMFTLVGRQVWCKLWLEKLMQGRGL